MALICYIHVSLTIIIESLLDWQPIPKLFQSIIAMQITDSPDEVFSTLLRGWIFLSSLQILHRPWTTWDHPQMIFLKKDCASFNIRNSYNKRCQLQRWNVLTGHNGGPSCQIVCDQHRILSLPNVYDKENMILYIYIQYIMYNRLKSWEVES